MIILEEKPNNPQQHQGNFAPTPGPSGAPESYDAPPPDYDTLSGMDREAPYAPDHKGGSRDLVLSPPKDGESDDEESRDGPSNYGAGQPPGPYTQYPPGGSSFSPPPGANAQYPPPGSPPQMVQGPGQYQVPVGSPPHMGFGPSYYGPAPTMDLKTRPPSFTRAPASGLPYNVFPPTYLIALGGDLANGFPPMPPPSPIQPHPFATHDVNEADWTRFLGDLQAVGLAKRKAAASAGGGRGLIGGLMAVIQMPTNAKTRELVDAWNKEFFHPRRMEAILAEGLSRIDSGGGPIPPLDPRVEQLELGDSGAMGANWGAGPSGFGGLDRRGRRAEKRAARIGGLLPTPGVSAGPSRLFLVGY